MRTLIRSLFLTLACIGLATADDAIPDRIRHLAALLPPPNQFVAIHDLGIGVGARTLDTDLFTFHPPADLDNRSTDAPPYAGRFPDMHLNLPLEVQPGSVNNLFMSDEPEEIRDDRKRDDGTVGATGVYAAATVAGKVPLRVLMDQTNGTSRPLKLWLIWVPSADGVMMERSHGLSVQQDSVLAGAEAFEQAMATPGHPRQDMAANTSLPLETVTIPAGQTAVVQDIIVPTTDGQIFSIVTEAAVDQAPSPDALASLPVLHNIQWNEETERLKKFVNPGTQPTRFERILTSFQHARGRFHFPDRVATACYAAPAWNDPQQPPVQVFSLFESIPGADRTTGDASTDNRGNYGAQVEFKLTLDSLPPDCHQAALLVLNPGGVWGGRHIVSDGKTLTVDSLFLSNNKPGLLRTGQAATLWRGEVKPGTTLTLSTEPMANISVSLWYMLVPIPPAGQENSP